MAKKSKKIKVRKGRDFRSDKNTDGLRKSKPSGYRFKGEKNFTKPTKKQIGEHLDHERDDIYFENRIERSDKKPFSKRGNRFIKGGGIESEKWDIINKDGSVLKKNLTHKGVLKLGHAKHFFTAVQNIEKGGRNVVKQKSDNGIIIDENWGNDGSTASNNKDYNDLYAMFPDNHKGAKQIWNQLSEKQKEGFLHDLDVTDAASEHIKDSWLEFINAKSEKDWLKNATNWDEMKEGGELTNDDYFQVVNHFVYFTQNYPNNFFDAFGEKDNYIRKHIEEKFDYGYKKHGSYGAMIYFWTELDGKNKEKLANWIKENYKGKKLSYEGDTTGIIDHFVYFTQNYPDNFMDAFGDKDDYIRKHIESKFDSYYKKYGSWSVMIKFWVELDGDNQEKFASWIKKNYTGHSLKFATGGKVGGRGFFGLEKGKNITDINELKVGDIILGHSKQFNADNTFKLVDRRQYGTSVNFDAVYWDAKQNKRIGNEDIGISQLNLGWEDFYFPKGKKYEGGGELTKEEIVLSKLDGNNEISCEELELIIESSPRYPVCHVGSMKLRKQFLRGCYKKI